MATECETILVKLKLDYLNERGAMGGNEEGYLAYVKAACENDGNLRRALEEALLRELADEVWETDGFNPDAGMSHA